MLDEITVGRYYQTTTILNKINNFNKLLITLLLSITICITNNIYLQLIYFILMNIIMYKTKINLKIYYKSIYNLKIIILFIIIINTIFKINIIDTIVSLFKLITILFLTQTLTFTTTKEKLTEGITLLLSPLKIFKININKISLSLTLAITFIPIILEKAQKILKSLAVRGLDYNNSKTKNKLLALKSMLVPMFILSIKTADNIAQTLELKNYDLNKKTEIKITNWKHYDTILLALFITVLAVTIGGKYALFNNIFI